MLQRSLTEPLHLCYTIYMPITSIAFHNILQIISQDSRLWSDVYKQRYGVPMPIDYFDRDKQRRCGQAVSAALCENPNPDRKDLPRKHLKRLALYGFKKAANSGYISDDVIREGLYNFSRLFTFYGMRTVSGDIRFFEAYSKGTERYNKKQRFKIMDATATAVAQGYECFCVTLTYDIKKHGHDRLEAWQKFSSHIQKTLHYFINHHHAKVVWVKESTKNGYPHAHCLLCFPKGTIKGYSKMKNGLKIKYGWIFDKVKKFSMSRIFDISVVKGKNLKYYLTKYLTKDDEHSISAMASQTTPYTVEQRKSIYCLFFTTLTGSRTIGISKALRPQKVKPNEKKEKGLQKTVEKLTAIDITHRPTNSHEAKNLRRLRRVLTSLCINFPCLNRPEIYSVNMLPENWHNVQLCKGNERLEEMYFNSFKESGQKVSCNGCLFSHLANFIVNKEDEWFNPRVLNIKRPELYERYFKESDYEDDFIFLNKLRERLNFLIKKQYVSCANIYSVVANEVHINYRFYAEKHKNEEERNTDGLTWEEIDNLGDKKLKRNIMFNQFFQEVILKGY